MNIHEMRTMMDARRRFRERANHVTRDADRRAEVISLAIGDVDEQQAYETWTRELREALDKDRS